ncbi:hypothetical protein K2173_025632 [Erythroxylum novogranatense]|uniref:Protein kinase domain-containing protein n=1 Tax=Erythroxylum novogranatense TaxID=1862640 RepID=A0AAV8SMZ1_9ROSI|nr:hypothetical protein K2173_025632 [Erythroxylum novogranatense]
MSCFPCFQSQKSRKSNSKRDHGATTKEPATKKPKPRDGSDEKVNIDSQTFTFRELATATKNFRQECLLGEGGFGRVYKGTLASNGRVVAVKQLDRHGLQGNKEFLLEVQKLSLLHHQNLVNLIGYCADGDQRLLVYEFMSNRSVEEHLLEMQQDKKPLDWYTRIRIALGAAKGLEYLHDQADPPVIYRDLKPSNILLEDDYNPKLSDFGLANLGPSGDSLVPSRVMGTYGYSAPEYSRSGNLTAKSDVYSFGVILLELITGRRAVDTTRPNDEQNLVSWAQPIFRDPKRFPDMADPLLNKQFPEKDLNQAVAMAAMCLQEEPAARPLMSDVVTALSFLSLKPEEKIPSPVHPSTPSLDENDNQQNSEADEDSSDNDDKSDRSRYSSDDKSDYEEEDDTASYEDDEGSESKHKGSINLSKKRGKSSKESTSITAPSSRKGSKRRVSIRTKSTSVSSAEDSGRGDQNAHLSQKSRKNSSSDQSGCSSERSRQNSSFSLSRSSKKSGDEDAYLSRGNSEKSDLSGSRRSHNRSHSSEDDTSGRSHNGNSSSDENDD